MVYLTKVEQDPSSESVENTSEGQVNLENSITNKKVSVTLVSGHSIIQGNESLKLNEDNNEDEGQDKMYVINNVYIKYSVICLSFIA